MHIVKDSFLVKKKSLCEDVEYYHNYIQLKIEMPFYRTCLIINFLIKLINCRRGRK